MTHAFCRELGLLHQHLVPPAFTAVLQGCWAAIVAILEDLLLAQSGEWEPLNRKARACPDAVHLPQAQQLPTSPSDKQPHA